MKKDIKKMKPGRRFLMTQVYNANQPINWRPGTIVKDGKAYQTTEVEIDWIEDRGDYYYVGYTPKQANGGAFGAARIYKETEPYEYGTLGFEAKYNYKEEDDD